MKAQIVILSVKSIMITIIKRIVKMIDIQPTVPWTIINRGIHSWAGHCDLYITPMTSVGTEYRIIIMTVHTSIHELLRRVVVGKSL